MAVYKGKDGVVKVGAAPTVVGQVVDWNVDQSADTAESTTQNQGHDWRTHAAIFKSWSGSLTVNFDIEDGGQELLAIGATVAAELYTESDGAGANYYSGDLIVTALNTSVPRDGFVTANITFTGTGPLTTEVVGA